MHRKKVYLIKFYKRLLLVLAICIVFICNMHAVPVLILYYLCTVDALSAVAIVTLSYHSAQRSV